MDVQVNILDLPGTKEQAIIFLQDKGLLPKTKKMCQWTHHDFVLLWEATLLEVYH